MILIRIVSNYFSLLVFKILSIIRRPRIFRIGFSTQAMSVSLEEFSTIENPKFGYLADPFIGVHKSDNCVFYEYYDFIKGKGRIDVLKVLDEGKIQFLGTCIEEDYHLSFPYIVHTDFGIFMVPETKSENAIFLYKCVSWPLKWERHLKLIDKVSAVDSIVFFYNNLWWIITTKGGWQGDRTQSELHIYFSENLLSTDWKEHKKNPVLINSYYGRNAGLVESNGVVYRCSQALRNYTYGSELNFHKIICISPEEYIEELLTESKLSNVHTYDSKGGLTVIDFRSKGLNL